MTLEEHAGTPWAIAYSPNGAILVAGLVNGRLQFWSAATGNSIAVLPGHAEWINTVAFSPDGATLATGADDNTGKIVGYENGRRTPQYLRGIQIGSPLSRSRQTGAPSPRPLPIVPLECGMWGRAKTSLYLRNTTSGVPSVAFSPDGATLASGSRDGNNQILEILRLGKMSLHSLGTMPLWSPLSCSRQTAR